MDDRRNTNAFLLNLYHEFSSPAFVTLLFKKSFIHKGVHIPITEDEARATIGVLHRRLNKRLYQGKNQLAHIGALEKNWEGRYHCHLVLDWPLPIGHLQCALRLDWREIKAKKGDLRWAYGEAHVREDCDLGAITCLMKARSKLPGSDAFDPLMIVRGPSSTAFSAEGRSAPCDWRSPYDRSSWERGKRRDERLRRQTEERVWQGTEPSIHVEMPLSSAMVQNKRRRLPSPKPRRANTPEFVVEHKRSRWTAGAGRAANERSS